MLKEQKRKEAQLRHDRLVDDDRKKKEARKAEQLAEKLMRDESESGKKPKGGSGKKAR